MFYMEKWLRRSEERLEIYDNALIIFRVYESTYIRNEFSWTDVQRNIYSQFSFP